VVVLLVKDFRWSAVLESGKGQVLFLLNLGNANPVLKKFAALALNLWPAPTYNSTDWGDIHCSGLAVAGIERGLIFAQETHDLSSFREWGRDWGIWAYEGGAERGLASAEETHGLLILDRMREGLRNMNLLREGLKEAWCLYMWRMAFSSLPTSPT
jgi:hypothetical protein